MKKFTLIFFTFLFISIAKIDAQPIDSLDMNSTFITLGESYYTDYFTSYAVYTSRSFFKDESGGLHAVFLSNYKMFYCYSEDGSEWTTEQISTIHDGDHREAVIYADADGNPSIAVTVNPYYDYGNPTGVGYGDEFRYNVYYFYKNGDSWMEELVYDSTIDQGFSGNYGCRVNELYKNMNGEIVLIGSRYGWYTYGGAFWEFTRSTEGSWSGLNIIHTFDDTPIDHATDLSRSHLKSNGERNLIYTRSYNASGLPELAYMHYEEGVWSAPTLLTTDMLHHASWDLSISPDEDMYLIHYSNNPMPHVNMYTDFSESTELPIDLSGVAEIQHAKIHITKDGILDLMVYPMGSDSVLFFVSEDYGITWNAPIYILRKDSPGVLPVTDQFSNQGVDLEYLRIVRISGVEPYGPDSLFYNNADHIISTLGLSDYEDTSDNLSLFPNPFTDEVRVNYTLLQPGELNIRVYSLQGKLIVDRNYAGSAGENLIPLDLEELESGTYILEIFESDRSSAVKRRATRKLVKY